MTAPTMTSFAPMPPIHQLMTQPQPVYVVGNPAAAAGVHQQQLQQPQDVALPSYEVNN